MKLEDALLEVLKDSPPNAALRKEDIVRAKALMAAPAAAPKAPAAPEGSDAPPQA